MAERVSQKQASAKLNSDKKASPRDVELGNRKTGTIKVDSRHYIRENVVSIMF